MKSSEPTHVLSCGIIPLRKHGEKWEFLLLRCFKYWDFPKGQKDQGEEPLEAAIRELTEETGIDQVKWSWDQKYRETESYGKGKIARYYLAEVNGETKIELLPNPVTNVKEHHEYRWMSYSEARELLVPRVQKIIDWAQKQISSQ